MHCVKGITTTFPNRHMKEGKCSVMTGTGLCKPWMPLKIKLMEKIPGNSNVGPGHT